MTEERTGLEHGEVCYLQIPARDIDASAAFYEQVFGWRIERGHASFEAPGMIGQWVDDRPPTGDSGILAWIAVDDIRAALDHVAAAGGQALEEPYRDGPSRLLSTARDPGGNTVGLVEHHHTDRRPTGA
jgi:predicted enzyme related to lactoylglutathione lyase